jgi:ATP-binding cassette subfamily B multidrug efflux pump
MNAMFGFFERRVDPFPKEAPEQPPKGIYQFCRYFTKGLEPWLIVMAILTALVAIAEASLFGVLGKVVDLLVASNPESFVENSWVSIVVISFLY